MTSMPFTAPIRAPMGSASKIARLSGLTRLPVLFSAEQRCQILRFIAATRNAKRIEHDYSAKRYFMDTVDRFGCKITLCLDEIRTR